MTRMEAELTLKQRIAKVLHESASKQDIMGYLNANLDCDILAQAALEAMIIDHGVGMSEAMANAFHDGTWFDGDTLIVPEVNMWNNAIKAAIAER